MNKNKTNNNPWLLSVIIFILIIGLIYLTFILLKDLPCDERGTFGDMFGSVNALFSGLAFGGIIITIILQKNELELQREELIDTRKEFVTQNKTLKAQRFENTFFNLLSLHHEIVNDIDYSTQIAKYDGNRYRGFMDKTEYEYVTIKGRDVFKDKFEILNRVLSQKSTESFNKTYLEFYETVQTDFGHYFRNLYRIIKLVDETEFVSKIDLEINENETKEQINQKYIEANFKSKYKYTSIIRSQLSDYELLWLFYNCLSDNGFEKFKLLVERYTILKNMPKDKLYDQELCNKYDSRAFEK